MEKSNVLFFPVNKTKRSPSRGPLSNKLRYAILKRDRFTCQYCGAKAGETKLQVDHFIPVSLYGPDDPWNLITACTECNSGKRADIDGLFVAFGNLEPLEINPNKKLFKFAAVTHHNEQPISLKEWIAGSSDQPRRVRELVATTGGKVLIYGQEKKIVLSSSQFSIMRNQYLSSDSFAYQIGDVFHDIEDSELDNNGNEIIRTEQFMGLSQLGELMLRYLFTTYRARLMCRLVETIQ